MSDTPEVPEVVGGPGTPAGPVEPGAPGAGGFGDLLASAQQAMSAQAEAAATIVEGSAGGGVVTVEMTGAGEVRAVRLSPKVVDPDDVEMLQDLIVAALHDAGLQVTELQRQALGAFGGLDLGGLGDMFGGPDAGPGPGSGTGTGTGQGG